MKRVIYGTWNQIKKVISDNNRLNLSGAGYDYYEVEQVPSGQLPEEPKTKRGGWNNRESGQFYNYDSMFSPRSQAYRDANCQLSKMEFFKCTLYKQ